VRALLATVLLSAALVTPASAAEPSSRDIALFTTNVQEYFYNDMEPVRYAYRAVASHELGWSPAIIAAWEPFIVDDVIRKESGGCWMIRGGTLYNSFGDSCWRPAVIGRRSDAGFGQVTPVLYRGRNSTLCRNAGLCSWQAVTASAWTSMLAVLVSVEQHGSYPWCYNAEARRYHNCKLAPKGRP
jgi:hypothetical protein